MRRHEAALAALALAGSIVALAVPESLSEETLVGTARVIDGDTIAIGSPRIRLWGIDAPELSQDCAGARCGLAARYALLKAIGDDAVTCTEVDRD